jgi:hypothetical protein
LSKVATLLVIVRACLARISFKVTSKVAKSVYGRW